MNLFYKLCSKWAGLQEEEAQELVEQSVSVTDRAKKVFAQILDDDDPITREEGIEYLQSLLEDSNEEDDYWVSRFLQFLNYQEVKTSTLNINQDYEDDNDYEDEEIEDYGDEDGYEVSGEPTTGQMVDGLEVREDTPNTDSISASLNDYEALRGIRVIPMSEFSLGGFYAKNDQDRVKELAKAIQISGEISPLIVVYDGNEDGDFYVLEGGHRIEALKLLGKEYFPALVVVDLEEASDDFDMLDQNLKIASLGLDVLQKKSEWNDDLEIVNTPELGFSSYRFVIIGDKIFYWDFAAAYHATGIGTILKRGLADEIEEMSSYGNLSSDGTFGYFCSSSDEQHLKDLHTMKQSSPESDLAKNKNDSSDQFFVDLNNIEESLADHFNTSQILYDGDREGWIMEESDDKYKIEWSWPVDHPDYDEDTEVVWEDKDYIKELTKIAAPRLNRNNRFRAEQENIGNKHKFILTPDGDFYAWSKDQDIHYGHGMIALENDGELFDELDDYTKYEWNNNPDESYQYYRNNGYATGTTSSGSFLLLNAPSGLNETQVESLEDHLRETGYRNVIVQESGEKNQFSSGKDALDWLSPRRNPEIVEEEYPDFFENTEPMSGETLATRRERV